MKSTVDIVIPVYNRVKFLSETVRSVINQSFREWNLYIIDDGSEVSIKAILENQFTDPRIHYLRQENQGNAVARNTGIGAGAAPYIALLDSDDVWLPEYLEISLDLLCKQPRIDIVFTGYYFIDENGLGHSKQPRFNEMPENILEALLMGMAIPPSTTVIKRELIVQFGGFIPGLDDWELWMRYAWNGCQFYFHNQPLVNYRIHPENFHKNWKPRREVHLAMLDKFYRTPGLSDEIIRKKAQAYGWQHFLFGIQALNSGSIEEAQNEFQQAFKDYPKLLKSNDTYWKIACAHQPLHKTGTGAGYIPEKARSSLFDVFLPSLPENNSIAGIPDRREIMSRCYYALSTQAHTLRGNYRLAIRYLANSIVSWPSIILRERVLRYFLANSWKLLANHHGADQ